MRISLYDARFGIDFDPPIDDAATVLAHFGIAIPDDCAPMANDEDQCLDGSIRHESVHSEEWRNVQERVRTRLHAYDSH